MDLTGGLNMYTFFVAGEGLYKQTRYGSDESPLGRKVKYLNRGGWDGDTERANQYFSEGEILTVKEIYVGRSSSEVEFTEHPGKKFNTVMFEDIK
ncbi:hypothetical protein [Bacillus phage vB_BceM_Bc431v3]|uniref:Uncharacterized protein n=1 Tax=Bacillus phage vB_BceM_Bc431v3 TaxID=1195072 RepID=M4HQ43_9CAUD|nr:hypothetical protein K201_gp202 [Bacillus phage vB_BceM_Bc431v3]AFQ96510.1 hypothetical protein [Bacillus phage vB_BceM_Bc431v3]